MTQESENQGAAQSCGCSVQGGSLPPSGLEAQACLVGLAGWCLSVATVRRPHTQVARSSSTGHTHPWQDPSVTSPPPVSSAECQAGSLLLVWDGLPDRWELPVEQGEPAEDEEHASPPQHFLALAVQRVAQQGLQAEGRSGRCCLTVSFRLPPSPGHQQCVGGGTLGVGGGDPGRRRAGRDSRKRLSLVRLHSRLPSSQAATKGQPTSESLLVLSPGSVVRTQV